MHPISHDLIPAIRLVTPVRPKYNACGITSCPFIKPERAKKGEQQQPRIPDHPTCILPRFIKGQEDKILYVLGEKPTALESREKRAFTGRVNELTVSIFKKLWRGNIAFDYAIRCPFNKHKFPPMSRAAANTHCRAYTKHWIEAFGERLERVVLLGAEAFKGYFGRSVPEQTLFGASGVTENGVAWLFLPSPSNYTPNMPVFRWWITVLKRFFETPIEELKEHCYEFSDVHYVVVSQDNIDQVKEWVEQATLASYDVETSGRAFDSSYKFLCVAVACHPKKDPQGNIVMVWPEETRDIPGAVELLKKLLCDAPGVTRIAHNATFDVNAIYAAFGFEPKFDHDTATIAKLVNSESRTRLEYQQEFVGWGGAKDIAYKHFGDYRKEVAVEDKERFGTDAFVYELIPRDELHRYCAADAYSTACLFDLQMTEESKINPWKPFHGSYRHIIDRATRIIKPALDAATLMQRTGFPVSLSALDALDVLLTAQIKDLKIRFAELTGGLNPNSPRQLADFYFEQQRIVAPVRTEKGAKSTKAEALEKIKDKHPSVPVLLKLRKAEKLKSSFVDKLRHLVYSDGRVHPSFNLDGTASGRTSCSDPNLQQIPRSESAHGKLLKSAFVPSRPSRVIVEIDYSQLELRVAAMLSGDDAMRKIFVEGKDYHQQTAELIAKVAWGINPEEVTKKHRSHAKTVNFGLLYGMGTNTLANRLGCSFDEADRIVSAVLGKFRGLREWIRRQIEFVNEYGYVCTYLNGQEIRRRIVFDAKTPVQKFAAKVSHVAVNTPVQGSASEIALVGLGRAARWVRTVDWADLLAFVHDAMIFEMEESKVEEGAAIVTRLMTEDFDTNGVPLVVDVDVGPSWGQVEALSI